MRARPEKFGEVSRLTILRMRLRIWWLRFTWRAPRKTRVVDSRYFCGNED